MSMAHVDMHRASKKASSQPYFSKKLFQTSFGPETEYLLIPRIASSANDELNPRPDPSSKTIMFFNGWMLRLSHWGMQMPRYTIEQGIAGFEDYNLLFFNNLGHGKSGMRAVSADEYLHLCAKAAAELADSFGIKQFFVMAHSMGALVSLEFERLYPERIEALAFISPLFSNPLRVFPLSHLLEPRLQLIRQTLENGAVVSFLDALTRALSSDILMNLWHKYFVSRTGSMISEEAFSKTIRKSLELDVKVAVVAFDAMLQKGDEIGHTLSNIKVPLTILLGERDFFTNPQKTIEIIRGLRPDVEPLVLKATTHYSNSEHPGEVNRVISNFFKGCG